MKESSLAIKAMERLFSSRSRFERFAMLYVHDRNEVQDILMDSYVYVWEHRQSIDLSGNIEAYMFNVVKHKCLDWLDHQLVRRNAENAMISDAEWETRISMDTLRAFDPAWLYDNDVVDRMLRALQQLPENTRQIFMLSRAHNMTYKQIAESTNLSVKSVEYHMMRALKHLRASLGDMLPFFMMWLATNGDF